MKVLIDADGCPVVDLTVSVCRKFGVECIILCDTSHVFSKPGARTVTVSKGADSVDFALVNLLAPGDIAVTQDYGLAAMCLAKDAVVLNQDGMVYDDTNMSSLLESRYYAKKVRMSGGRLKGSKKRTVDQDEKFSIQLIKMIDISK